MKQTPAPPGVTLVIGFYNHASFVSTALASAFGQDYENLTVIVADDASTDDTQRLVDDVLAANGWAAERVFHSVNVGICAMRNEVLTRVRTPYVAFISGDDWMAPHRISTLVARLEEAGPEYALVYSDMVLVDQAGRPTGGLHSELRGGFPPDRHERTLEALVRDGGWMPAPSVLSRAECLRAVGGYDETLPFEDYDMWLRLSRRYRFAFCPQALVYYRTHPGQLTKTLEANRARLLLPALIAILRKHLGVDPATDDLLVRRMFGWAVESYLAGGRAAEVAWVFRLYARRFPSAKALCYATAAGIGVPGALVSSLRDVVR